MSTAIGGAPEAPKTPEIVKSETPKQEPTIGTSEWLTHSISKDLTTDQMAKISPDIKKLNDANETLEQLKTKEAEKPTVLDKLKSRFATFKTNMQVRYLTSKIRSNPSVRRLEHDAWISKFDLEFHKKDLKAFNPEQTDEIVNQNVINNLRKLNKENSKLIEAELTKPTNAFQKLKQRCDIFIANRRANQLIDKMRTNLSVVKMMSDWKEKSQPKSTPKESTETSAPFLSYDLGDTPLTEEDVDKWDREHPEL